MPLHDTVSLTISRLQFEQVLQHRAELAEERWERTKENLEKSASHQQWLDERLNSSRQKNAYLEGEAAASTKAGMVLDKVSKRSEIAHHIMLDLTVLPHNASQDRRQAGIVAAAAGRRAASAASSRPFSASPASPSPPFLPPMPGRPETLAVTPVEVLPP